VNAIIPGGAGVRLVKQQTNKVRHIILVKGYEHEFGRAINVLKALKNIDLEHYGLRVVVFAAHMKPVNFMLENGYNFEYFHRHQLRNDEVISLMSKSLLYIANSTSDGIPNTLLEAMSTGAFPIQSNPGGATEEVIEDKVNGLILHEPESISSIADTISEALENPKLLREGFKLNRDIIRERFTREFVGEKIRKLYV
jgi:glycosyltransferase involved in cell wall biosynthesis